MAAETIDQMEVVLTANLGPLFSALEQGLRQVRSRVQQFKEGRIDLTASIDKMLGQLKAATAKTSAWRRETDAVAVVRPSIDSSRFMAGLGGIKAGAERIARQLGNIFFAFAGLHQITGIFQEWIRASNSQEAALARLRAGMANVKTAGVDAFQTLVTQAKSLQHELGIWGDEEIESAQAMLATFQLNEQQISAVIPRLLDMAAAMEKTTGQQADLQQLAIVLGKAFAGQAGYLSRYGVMLDEDAIKADRFSGILKSLDNNFEHQAQTLAATGVGPLRSLGKLWGDMKEVLGDFLKAILNPLVKLLKPLLEGFLALPAPVRTGILVFGLLAIAMKATNTSLVSLITRLLLFVDTMTASVIVSVRRLVAALLTADWAGFAGGITASLSALRAAVLQMNLLGKATLVVGAAYAGWKIGRWISDITGLTAATSTAAKQESSWTDEELRGFAARLKARTGIELTAAAMREWIQLSVETRRRLEAEAAEAGRLTYTVAELTQARQADIQAARDQARLNLWAKERQDLEDYLAYYRRSRAEQIAIDIDAVEKQLVAASAGSKEREKLEKQLQKLLQEAAQEKIRQEQDAARKAKEAWQKSIDAQKAKVKELLDTIQAAVQKAKSDWADMSKEMAGDMLKAHNPAEFERAQVRIQAAEMERTARSLFEGQRLAEQLTRIEDWKTEKLSEINDRYRQQEQEKQDRAVKEQQRRTERALQQAMRRVRDQVQAALDPIGEMVRRAYDTVNARTALWAERIGASLRPVEQAFYSLMLGMKVKWSDVLRQMIAQFLMQFVSKFLAWIGQMVLAWITGETAKTAATTAGATAQAAAAKVQEQSNAGVAASALSAATAEFFEAHAWIPFAGAAIAAAFTAEMMALWMATTAAAKGASQALVLATGGLVSSPTLALVGEAGPELVAPASDFKAVVGGLLANTLRTVKMAAVGVGDNLRGGGDGQRAGGQLVLEPHYHGMAFVDTGQKSFLRAAGRKMGKALASEKKYRLGGS